MFQRTLRVRRVQTDDVIWGGRGEGGADERDHVETGATCDTRIRCEMCRGVTYPRREVSE